MHYSCRNKGLNEISDDGDAELLSKVQQDAYRTQRVNTKYLSGTLMESDILGDMFRWYNTIILDLMN
jgi:hypothetical protein